jgi:hypothetical protein
MMPAADRTIRPKRFPIHVRIGRVASARVWLAVVYLAVNGFFGGRAGVIVGVVVIAAWLVGVPRGAFWAAAASAMAVAPVALVAQGLPGTPVVGVSFGTDHLIAHALVGLSLSLAGFAILWEIVEMRAGSGRGRPERPSGMAVGKDRSEPSSHPPTRPRSTRPSREPPP